MPKMHLLNVSETNVGIEFRACVNHVIIYIFIVHIISLYETSREPQSFPPLSRTVRMVWILVLIVLGLIGFLVEMWLSYQKQADELMQEQEATLKQIDEHHKALEKLEKRTDDVGQRLAELGGEQNELKQELEQGQAELAELQDQRKSRSPTRHPVELDEV